MAILTASSSGADPAWCSGHYEPSLQEAFHQHAFNHTWGTYDEKIRLGITRFDSGGHTGEARIEVQYLTEITEVQGSVSLDDVEASVLAGHLIATLSTKKSTGGAMPVLFLRCAYEAGKAFVVAFRSLRTASPRTASSQSRSIRSM